MATNATQTAEQTTPQQQQQQQSQPQSLVTVIENEAAVKTKTIPTTQFGDVRVHIQGELDDHKAVFLTVHDIGSNHSSWQDFVDSDAMTEIRNRSVFIHVDVCGQEDGAQDVEEFPTIQQMRHKISYLLFLISYLYIISYLMPQLGELVIREVLDALSVPLVVGLGEGAGANILARFGLAHPTRVLGLILVHLVSTEVGFLETLKDRLFHRRNSQQMSALDIVALHKIGHESEGENSRALMDSYKQRVQTLNAKNLRKYVTQYMNRKEIHDLKELDVLLVSGGKSLYCAGVESIYSKCNKTKTSLLKADLCTDVISECPEKLAQSLLLFVKGLGFLTSCPQIDGSRSDSSVGLKSLGSIGRRRTLSMEEYDIPRMRRLSLTK